MQRRSPAGRPLCAGGGRPGVQKAQGAPPRAGRAAPRPAPRSPRPALLSAQLCALPDVWLRAQVLLKLVKDADELLAKSQNHKALKKLEESLSAMVGMDASSGLLRWSLPCFLYPHLVWGPRARTCPAAQLIARAGNRSGIQLRLCKVHAELKRHEEALLACDACVARRSEPVAGLFVDPHRLAEALEVRGDAHIQVLLSFAQHAARGPGRGGADAGSRHGAGPQLRRGGPRLPRGRG